MKDLKQILTKYTKGNITLDLKKAYVTLCKDEDFKAFINKLEIKDEVAYKYAMKLHDSYEESKNCIGCKSLSTCRNNVTGYFIFPKIIDGKIDFNYKACKYQENLLKMNAKNKSKYYNMPPIIKSARMKNIEIGDKKRVPIIKWLKKFYDEYPNNKHLKGLFLNGSFGSGKTFLISALLNELAEKDYNVIGVYFPEFLLDLKNFNEDYQSKVMSLKKADILLIDDIGAENVSSWSRDEVLGTILQYRMDNELPTFFTSNYDINALEIKLASSYGKEDAVSARRIIERIKQLTNQMELISENKRN